MTSKENQPSLTGKTLRFEWNLGEAIPDNDEPPTPPIPIEETPDDDENLQLEVSSNDVEWDSNASGDGDSLSIDQHGHENEGISEHSDFLDDESHSDNDISYNDSTTEKLDNIFSEAEAHFDREIANVNQVIHDTENNNVDSMIKNANKIDDTSTNSIEERKDLRQSDHTTLNNRGRPKRKAAEAGVDRLIMDTRGKDYKLYPTKNLSLLIHPDLNRKRISRTKKTVLFAMIKNKIERQNGEDTTMHTALKVIFLTAQMSAKKGIKLFGARALAAMVKGFTQLDQGAFPGKPVVDAMDTSTITE